MGEGELVAEEKEKIVKELVQSKPALFLQRFGRFLRFTHLTFMCAMQREHPNKLDEFSKGLGGWVQN